MKVSSRHRTHLGVRCKQVVRNRHGLALMIATTCSFSRKAEAFAFEIERQMRIVLARR